MGAKKAVRIAVSVAAAAFISWGAFASEVRQHHVFDDSAGRWKLALSGRLIEYEVRLPNYREAWWSTDAKREPVNGGLRYSGQLVREYVVAGEAVSDDIPFQLIITKRPCVDRRGRARAVTALLTLDPGSKEAAEERGCGRHVPL